MVNFFIHRPIFASSIAIIMVLAGAIALRFLPVAQLPEGHLSGRQRGGGGEHCNDAIGTTDQRRAGHDLHVRGQRQ